MTPAARFEELAARVLAPLVLGGKVEPVAPIGARLAVELGDLGRSHGALDPELGSRIDLVRVRRARELAPVDTLPPLGPAEIAMACAYNDLLQLTHPDLTGLFTHGRRARLLSSVVSLAARIGPPATLGDALARYATFRRAFEASRTDKTVTWWTGSAVFRGADPPARLLVWRSLRRVEVSLAKVPLALMGDGLGDLTPAQFHAALGAWLGCSPLSDLAQVGREAPPFAWGPATLALLELPEGRVLAGRAVAQADPARATEALEQANEMVELPESRERVAGFKAETAARAGA